MPGWDYVERLTANTEGSRKATPEVGSPVRIVSVDIPLGELIGLTFKLFVAGLPLGILLASVWYLLASRGV